MVLVPSFPSVKSGEDLYQAESLMENTEEETAMLEQSVDFAKKKKKKGREKIEMP